MNWISVNDRLPEEDELVLAAVTGCDKKENIKWKDAYLLARFYPEEGWYLEDHWEATDFRIRWWMRLPEDVPDGKTVRTNADRIRSMSDEELHKFCVSLTDDGWRFACENKPECDPVPPQAHMCNDCFLNWLRQPSKED